VRGNAWAVGFSPRHEQSGIVDVGITRVPHGDSSPSFSTRPCRLLPRRLSSSLRGDTADGPLAGVVPSRINLLLATGRGVLWATPTGGPSS
jgi:hypothetical protein